MLYQPADSPLAEATLPAVEPVPEVEPGPDTAPAREPAPEPDPLRRFDPAVPPPDIEPDIIPGPLGQSLSSRC